MPIVSNFLATIMPRDELLSTIGLMIDEAASSPDDIDPYALAGTILASIEERINSVDHDGTVIYRA